MKYFGQNYVVISVSNHFTSLPLNTTDNLFTDTQTSIDMNIYEPNVYLTYCLVHTDDSTLYIYTFFIISISNLQSKLEARY